MWAPQNTPNALASAQDLPIPERLPDITAAATRRLGEPATGFKHGPSSSSPSQAPQVREMNLLSPPYLRSRSLEDGASPASYVPLGEPSLMDDHGVLRAQANLLAPPHLCRSVRLGHAIQHLHQAAISEQEQATSGGAGYDSGIIIVRPNLQNDKHPVLAVALAPGSYAASYNKSALSSKEGEADTGSQGLSSEVEEEEEDQTQAIKDAKARQIRVLERQLALLKEQHSQLRSDQTEISPSNGAHAHQEQEQEDQATCRPALQNLGQPTDGADNLVNHLRHFYSIYAPEKVENAQTVAMIYGGKLACLNKVLAQKYNAYLHPDGQSIDIVRREALPVQRVSTTSFTSTPSPHPLAGPGETSPKVLQTKQLSNLSSADTVSGNHGWSTASSATNTVPYPSHAISSAQLRVKNSAESEGRINRKRCAQAENGAETCASEKPVEIVIKLGLDYAHAGHEGTTLRAGFLQSLAQDLGKASGMPYTTFHILKVAPGRDVVAPIIVLDAQIHADSLGRGQTPMMVAKELQRQVTDQSSALKKGVMSKNVFSISVPGPEQSSPSQAGSPPKGKLAQSPFSHGLTFLSDVFRASNKAFSGEANEEAARAPPAAETVTIPPPMPSIPNQDSAGSRRKQPVSMNPYLLSAEIEKSPHTLHPQAVEHR
jgi:hypothetical protein